MGRKLAELPCSNLCDGGMKFRWRLVTSRAPQGLLLKPIGFGVFIYDLDHRTQCTSCKFSDSTKLRGVADVPDEHDMLPFRGILQGGKMRQQEYHEIQQREIPSPGPNTSGV